MEVVTKKIIKIPKVIVTRLETVMDDSQSGAGEWVNSFLAG